MTRIQLSDDRLFRSHSMTAPGIRGARWFAVLALLALSTLPARGDEVERLNGITVKGKVVREAANEVIIRVTTSGKAQEIVIPTKDIRSVTVNGKTRVVNRDAGTSATAPASGAGASKTSNPSKTTSAAGTSSAQKTASNPTRAAGVVGSDLSKADVDALIDKQGKTKPDWFDATPLNYPKTLDLSWPKGAEGNWNNQVNMGQYLWDVINPNPSKWKEGVRLLHHIMQVNAKDKEVIKRCCNSLGHLYGDCLEDHARAAFWWKLGDASSLDLAYCYYKLGSKSAAIELLKEYGDDDTRNGVVIKLWADMGDIDKALEVADEKIRNGAADTGYLAQGDVYRIAGRYQEALASYQKVLSVPQKDAGRDLQRNQNRARAAAEAVKVFDALDLSRIADGSYRSKSLGYEADIEVEVVVKSGRIETAKVTQHREKQFYSAINDTTRQIVEKQGIKGVDATAGATITSQAIINAAGKALASGAK